MTNGPDPPGSGASPAIADGNNCVEVAARRSGESPCETVGLDGPG